MRLLLGGAVLVTCVIVSAAAGLWLWQQHQASVNEAAEQKRIFDQAAEFSRCAEFTMTLADNVITPGSVDQAAVDAATAGSIKCRDAGIF